MTTPPHSDFWRVSGKLALLFLALGLITSRLSLILHEFVGHGLVAVLQGGVVTDFQLYLFGGGWIRYQLPQITALQEQLISLGGIALELLVGAVLLLLSRRLRRPGLLWFGLVSFGFCNVIHGLIYLVDGTHYGFGDGHGLHVLLAQRRWLVVLPGSILLVLASGYFAQQLTGTVSIWSRLDPSRAVVALLIGVTLALSAHGALMLAERALRRDQDARRYARMMAVHKGVRWRIEAELRKRAQLARARTGQPPRPHEIRRWRTELAARHPVFPLRVVLLVSVLLAAAGGVVVALRRKQPPSPDGPASQALSGRGLRRAWLVTALSIALVVALQRPWFF